MSIQKKMTLVLTFLIFSTVLSLGWAINDHARTIVLAETLQYNDDALSNVNTYYLRPYLQKMETVIGRWAETPELAGPLANTAKAYASDGLPQELASVVDAWRGFAAGNAEILTVYYSSQNSGKLISSSTDMGLPPTYDARKRDWYREAAASPLKTHWSSLYVDAGASNKSVITLSRAVIREGETVGVVAMDIEITLLSEQISGIDIGEGGHLMILSDRADVYVHPDQRLLNKKMTTYPWISRVLSEETGSEYFTLSGSPYTYSFLTVPETGWKLICVRPVAFSGLLADIQSWMMGAALIAALIAVLFAQLSFRYLLRPVGAMVAVIDDVAAGNMDSRMAIHSQDEFQKMGFQFNVMLDKIRDLMREREEHLDRLIASNREALQQKEEIQALHEETYAMNENLSELLEEIGENYAVTVRALANAIEASDSYTRGHCDRVGEYALKLARRMNLSEPDMKNLKYASMLHDIGKIGIPGSILNKAGSLTEEEFAVIRQHPRIGCDILEDISFLEECRTILLQHHERMDGRGYPQALSGKALHPSARILAIADSFDAMTSARAYRKVPLCPEAALEQLRQGRGTQYDAEMVDAFTELWQSEDLSVQERLA